MSMAETAKLAVDLSFKSNAGTVLGGANRQLTSLSSGFGKLGKTAGAGLSSLATNITRLGAAAAIGIGAAVGIGIRELAKAEVATAQTEAVIKSTGAAAHVTAAQIEALSTKLQNTTSIEDDVVRSGANMLLTFTNVKNAAGAGNDIFNQSVATLADMSVALGNDMPKAAIQLGKALNDPLKGVTALTKVGVTFTEQQKAQFKANGALSKEEEKHYVALGKTNKASAERYKAGILTNKQLASQKMILKELNTEFGGSGAAKADTYTGKMALLGFAVEDAEKALAEGFLPVILKVSTFLQTQLAKPEVIAAIKELGQGLAGAFDQAAEFAMKIPWSSVLSSVKGIASAAKVALDLFLGMPSWVKEILIGGFVANKLTGGAVGSIIGQLGSGLIKGVLGMNAGVVNINAAVVNGGGGLPGGGPKVPGGGISKTFLAGTALSGVALVAAEATVWNDHILPGLQDQSAENIDALGTELKTGSLAQLRQSLDGLQKMPDQLSPLEKALYELNASGIKTHTESLEAALKAEIINREKNEPIPPPSKVSDYPQLPGSAAISPAFSLSKFLNEGAQGVFLRGVKAGNPHAARDVAGTMAKNQRIAAELTAIGPGAAGVYARAVHAGFDPSMATVAATLARGNARTTAAAAKADAAARKTAAAVSKTAAAVFAGAEKTGLRLLGVKGAIDATTAAINAKQFTTTIVGSDWYNLPKPTGTYHPPLVQPAVVVHVSSPVTAPVSARDVTVKTATRAAYGRDRTIK